MVDRIIEREKGEKRKKINREQTHQQRNQEIVRRERERDVSVSTSDQ